jgi:large subunit ribosomal protein L9
MEVILRQDVEKVGLRGEVVDVAAGFARNYLIPRRLAETATPAKVAELRKLEQKRARHEAQSFEQAQEIVNRLEAVEIRFDVQAGETGTLFGSVTATDVAERVWEAEKVRIDRRKLDLPDSIKRIGRYQVPVELFADVTPPPRRRPRRPRRRRPRRNTRRWRPRSTRSWPRKRPRPPKQRRHPWTRRRRSRFPTTPSTARPTPPTTSATAPPSNNNAQASPQVDRGLWI